MKLETVQYKVLVKNIGNALNTGRETAIYQVNQTLVRTNWEIGRYIVEFEQKGNIKAEYGSQLLDRLSKDLTIAYGKGFSRSNLFQIRQFYVRFEKIQTVSGQFGLTWSHYMEILKAEGDLEFSFYLRQCEKERWSVRELKRNMKSMLFHRLALQKGKTEVFKLSNEGHKIEHPADLIKDPFVLEFLNIHEANQYHESELEDKIISHLQQFIMEMGKGFAFIARQYRMNIANRHFYVDLFFYHRILKCFVLIDLKRGEIDHQDIGQMNLYLNYFKREEAADDDNTPIGIVLGASKNNVLVEYAMEGITNQILLAKYQLYLPPKDRLESLLKGLLEE
jgi:predicted nuclease of restriction endonuclease-like (RecB) superfamily